MTEPMSSNDQSVLAMKIDRQRRRLDHLEKIQALNKRRDLIERLLNAESRVSWLSSQAANRESAYMKGYRQGYMDAVLRLEKQDKQ